MCLDAAYRGLVVCADEFDKLGENDSVARSSFFFYVRNVRNTNRI